MKNIIEIKYLSKVYNAYKSNKINALDNLNLKIPEGTIFGLLISRITLLMLPLFAEQKYTFVSFQFNFLSEELWLLPLSLLIGVAASLIPTILSYNINIPKTLSNE